MAQEISATISRQDTHDGDDSCLLRQRQPQSRRQRTEPAPPSTLLPMLPTKRARPEATATSDQESFVEAFDSAELRSLKALKWKNGRELTAYIQDIALQQGKRAMVATSGGSFKKFVCSSESPCPWLINAVCTRPRPRKQHGADGTVAAPTAKKHNHQGDGEDLSGEHEMATIGTVDANASMANRKYWYISSAYLVHTNCTGMAKPTARQLKDVSVLKLAVQSDAKVSSAALVEQLKSQARLLCSKSMVYKAKIELLDDLDTVEQGPGARGAAAAASVQEQSQQLPQPSLDSVSSDLVQSTRRLPAYLARLSALNPDILHTVERDPSAKAHFYRALVALDPRRFFSQATPLVFGIDSVTSSTESNPAGTSSSNTSTTMTTTTQLVCLGCDASLNTITLAAALVPEPSELHFTWFLAKLIEYGYPLETANAVFTDGKWPVSSACAHVGVQRMIQDTRYLISELTQSIDRQLTPFQQQLQPTPHASSQNRVSLSPDQLSLIWAAQTAETGMEFHTALHKLELPSVVASQDQTHHPSAGALAAQELRAVDPRRWALFPHFSTARLYGWQTTRFSPNGELGRPVIFSPHHEMRLPCEFFKMLSLLLLNETYQRQERAAQWGREQRVVTPEAECMMQEQMKLVPLYDVAMSSPQIAFVWNPQKAPQIRQRRVDLQEKTCTCGTSLQFGVPCRHILSVLRKVNALGQSFDYFDDCYRVQAFNHAHKDRHIELPLDETVHADTSWLPAKHALFPTASTATAASPLGASEPGLAISKKDGSPSMKKRRVRNKQADLRKRPMYKCRKCNLADGHNSMTCPNQRTKSAL